MSKKIQRFDKVKAISKADKVQYDTGDTVIDTTANQVYMKVNNEFLSLSDQQNNLRAGYGISIENNVVSAPFYTKVADKFDLNTLDYGFVRGYNMTNAPTTTAWFYIQATCEGKYGMQLAWTLPTSTGEVKKQYRRDKVNNVWTDWILVVSSESTVPTLLTSEDGDERFFALTETHGERTTITINVDKDQTELTVNNELKPVLVEALSTVHSIKNGTITLTYDGSNVKILVDPESSNVTNQATFTFYGVDTPSVTPV